MNDVIDCNQMILNTYNNIEKSVLEKNNKIYQTWKKVITSIKNNGQKIYEHSSIVDLKNGILLIESDHSGWIQLLQLNSRYIINGFKMFAKEFNIESLAFKLKGTNAKLYSENNYEKIYNEESVKKQKEIEINSKILEKYENNSENSKKFEKNVDLPQNLLDKFKSIEEKLLTKN